MVGRRPPWATALPMHEASCSHKELGVGNSNGRTSYHSHTGTFTAIDLSFCSPNVILEFNWRAIPDLHRRGIFPIIITSEKVNPQIYLPRWRLDKADWQLFTEFCSSDRSTEEFDSSDEAAISITDVIHLTAVISISKLSGHFPRRPVPWWTPECPSAVKAKRLPSPASAEIGGNSEGRNSDSCSASLEGDKERVTGDLCFDFHMKGSSEENIWEIYCPSPTSCKTTTLLSVPNPAEEAEVLADHFARPEQDPTSPSAHNRRHSESRGISLTSGVNLVMPLSLRMTSRWH